MVFLHRLLLIMLVLPLLLVSEGPRAQAQITSSARPDPVPVPSFGLNSHLATRYTDPSSMEVPAAALSDLGVDWVREDFHWHRVQPRPDMWDWTFTDAALQSLLVRGINVLGVLGPSVGWATPYPNDTPNDVSYYAPNPDLFVEYARGVVSRYHRYVDYWEIWNEPDDGVFWSPAPDSAAYARMLIRTAEVIRSIDPEAKILIGGFNPFDTTFLREVAEYGAWDSFDIIAIHPYVNPYEPESGNLAAAADAVRALAARYGQKPIWVTELGWASGPADRDAIGITDEDFQANYLVRSILLLWEAGVEKIFWYNFKDDPGNPYGLVRLGTSRTDYTPRKPAFYALQTLIRETRGAQFIERRDLFRPQVVEGFEQVERWRRVSQPNGTLRLSNERTYQGNGSAEINYNFTTRQNDYVAFERNTPIPMQGQPFAVGLWVYGDGSTHGVKIWIRDAEGELLQFVLGAIGSPGWHFLAAPIGGPVEPGNRLAGEGNGRIDFPASIVAIVVDDIVDEFVGSGRIWIDDLTVIHGREAYNFRLQRGNDSLDILWSPPGARLVLNTRVERGILVERGGTRQPLTANNSQLRMNVGPAPIYLWHRR